MADPLSLAASIIAVVTTAESIVKTVSKKIKLLRNAPNELLALNNEIADLAITLRNVSGYISSSSTSRAGLPHDVLQQMVSLVDRAKDRILQLDQLVHYQFLKAGSLDGDYKVFRLRWARAKDTVEHHRQAIRDIKQNILIQMLLINSSHQSRIHLIVDEVSIISNQIQVRQTNASDHAARQFDISTQLLRGILDEQTALRSERHSGLRLIDQSFQPTGRALTTQTESMAVDSIIGINAYVPNPSRLTCTSNCSCNCHKSCSFRSPSSFGRLLGYLFLSYAGQPFHTIQKCSTVSCQARSQVEARVQYFFPFWFWNKMIDLQLRISSFKEPSISLIVRGVFPLNGEFNHLIINDNEKGLQRLLDNGSARPNDVSIFDGLSALKSAVVSCSLRSCKILLASGADPRFEPIRGITVMDYVWNTIYAKSQNETILEALKQLFPLNDSERGEDQSRPKLHKIILGGSSASLEEALTLEGLVIDEMDSRGYTALLWAVSRNDNLAVELLLKAGADPNISTPTGSSPLHFASWRQNLPCVRMLLNAGATLNHVDSVGDTALHHAAQRCANLDLLEVLIFAGIDISQRDRSGSIALEYMAHLKTSFSTRGIKLLLGLGANINAQDDEGDTPLQESLHRVNNFAADALLKYGADCTVVNDNGDTILHAAAGYGNLETLTILRAAHLTNIDPYVVNSNKKTALETAQQRDTKPDGFIDLLLVLLFEIRNRNDHIVRKRRSMGGGVIIGDVTGDDEGENLSEAEEFHDAEE